MHSMHAFSHQPLTDAVHTREAEQSYYIVCVVMACLCVIEKFDVWKVSLGQLTLTSAPSSLQTQWELSVECAEGRVWWGGSSGRRWGMGTLSLSFTPDLFNAFTGDFFSKHSDPVCTCPVVILLFDCQHLTLSWIVLFRCHTLHLSSPL